MLHQYSEYQKIVVVGGVWLIASLDWRMRVQSGNGASLGDG